MLLYLPLDSGYSRVIPHLSYLSAHNNLIQMEFRVLSAIFYSSILWMPYVQHTLFRAPLTTTVLAQVTLVDHVDNLISPAGCITLPTDLSYSSSFCLRDPQSFLSS